MLFRSPVALRMVAETYGAIKIPIIGVGGIMSGTDALEFMIAGAQAVEIGTASLVSPTACQDILSDMVRLAEADGAASLAEYTGSLQLWNP